MHHLHLYEILSFGFRFRTDHNYAFYYDVCDNVEGRETPEPEFRIIFRKLHWVRNYSFLRRLINL